MGFYCIIDRKPKDIQKAIEVLEEFKCYLENGNMCLDARGFLDYVVIKNENQVLDQRYPDEIYAPLLEKIAPNAESYELVKITIKNTFPYFAKRLQKGKWLIYWYNIQWCTPEPMIERFFQTCHKYDCGWLWDEICRQSNARAEEL